MALCAALMCQTGTTRGLLYIPFPGQTGTAKGSLSFPLLVGWILRSWAGQGILTRGLSRSQPESCWHSRREHRHWWVGGSSLNRNCSQTGSIINRSLSPFQYCTDCWEESLAALRALPGLPSGMTVPLKNGINEQFALHTSPFLCLSVSPFTSKQQALGYIRTGLQCLGKTI